MDGWVSADGCWMGVGWVLDGCQMSSGSIVVAKNFSTMREYISLCEIVIGKQRK